MARWMIDRPRHRSRLAVIGGLLAALATPAAGGGALEPGAEVPEPSPLASAAENHLDVPYLDASRDVLYPGQWGLEHSTRVNIHVPPGDGPFPAILTVHGGAYTSGSKDSRGDGPGWHGQSLDLAMERGYVVVNVNYILGHDIHPQVQRDFKELVRFLRKHADR